jgi:cell division protein FtsL
MKIEGSASIVTLVAVTTLVGQVVFGLASGGYKVGNQIFNLETKISRLESRIEIISKDILAQSRLIEYRINLIEKGQGHDSKLSFTK